MMGPLQLLATTLLLIGPVTPLRLGQPIQQESGQGGIVLMTADVDDTFRLIQDDSFLTQYSANFNFISPRQPTTQQWLYYALYNYSSEWTHANGSVSVSSLQSIAVSVLRQAFSYLRFLTAGTDYRLFAENILDEHSVPIGVAGTQFMLTFYMLQSRTYVRYAGIDLTSIIYTNPVSNYALGAVFFRNQVIDHLGSDIISVSKRHNLKMNFLNKELYKGVNSFLGSSRNNSRQAGAARLPLLPHLSAHVQRGHLQKRTSNSRGGGQRVY